MLLSWWSSSEILIQVPLRAENSAEMHKIPSDNLRCTWLDRRNHACLGQQKTGISRSIRPGPVYSLWNGRSPGPAGLAGTKSISMGIFMIYEMQYLRSMDEEHSTLFLYKTLGASLTPRTNIWYRIIATNTIPVVVDLSCDAELASPREYQPTCTCTLSPHPTSITLVANSTPHSSTPPLLHPFLLPQLIHSSTHSHHSSPLPLNAMLIRSTIYLTFLDTFTALSSLLFLSCLVTFC